MNDMSNISIVNGELVDYEYEQQKLKTEKQKKIKKFSLRLIIWFAFILPLAAATIKLFIEFASFAGRYS